MRKGNAKQIRKWNRLLQDIPLLLYGNALCIILINCLEPIFVYMWRKKKTYPCFISVICPSVGFTLSSARCPFMMTLERPPLLFKSFRALNISSNLSWTFALSVDVDGLLSLLLSVHEPEESFSLVLVPTVVDAVSFEPDELLWMEILQLFFMLNIRFKENICWLNWKRNFNLLRIVENHSSIWMKP